MPSFEERGVKIDGKCTAITRSLSQAILLQSDKSFLSNLETSAKIYERIVRGKQVSKNANSGLKENRKGKKTG